MTEKLFASKTAIVTGAGKGIGFEICRLLVQEGASVVLNDIDEQLAFAAAENIGKGNTPGRCIAIAGDASDMTVIRKLIEKAVSEYSHLDIAIANAGITLFGDFFDYDVDAFSQVMKVNAAGSFFLAQQAALQMRKQATGGSLLFMSSVTAHQAHKHLGAYGMSKAAIEMLAKNLVIELSEYNITVNSIAPGATRTERTAHDGDYEKTWSDITPLGRPATATDIAYAALFLVSPHARHITGQNLTIDGGWTAVSPSPYR